MTKFNVLLTVALVASSLLLVKTAYDARRLFAALDRAQQEERTLEAERQRLDAELQVAATNLRVEKVARERLQMRNANAAVTQYVQDAASGVQP